MPKFEPQGWETCTTFKNSVCTNVNYPPRCCVTLSLHGKHRKQGCALPATPGRFLSPLLSASVCLIVHSSHGHACLHMWSHGHSHAMGTHTHQSHICTVLHTHNFPPESHRVFGVEDRRGQLLSNQIITHMTLRPENSFTFPQPENHKLQM